LSVRTIIYSCRKNSLSKTQTMHELIYKTINRRIIWIATVFCDLSDNAANTIENYVKM
jgi:hypothetical protein